MPNIEIIMRQITGDLQPAVIFKTTENSKCTETSNSEDKLKGVLYKKKIYRPANAICSIQIYTDKNSHYMNTQIHTHVQREAASRHKLLA